MKLILLYAFLALTHSQPAENLLDWLPANTQTVVVVNDFQRAVKVYQSAEHQESGNSFQERFAVGPDDVAALIVGEFARAELIQPDGTISEVAIAHTAADFDGAIKRIYKRLQQHQAKVGFKSFGSHRGIVITRQSADGTEHVSVHLIHDGRILLADSVAAAELVVEHIDTAGRSRLTEQKNFAQVWNKYSPALAGEDLAIVWYVDPWKQFQSRQQAADEHAADGAAYQFAKRHGMNGILGVGGSVVVGEHGEQTVQAFAYAPKPVASSLQMATHLQGTADLTLPEWVSNSVADIVVLHGNVGKALENAGLLFDDGFADGVEGTYDEVLFDLQDLLDLDIKKELYPQLGPRLYMLNGTVENRAWQPLVVAIEVKNAERVAETLRILIADDPEATEVVLADKSDLVWQVPGKRGGRDFVLGMLKGLAVYTNDLEFAKTAMRFDGSKPLLSANQFVVARSRAVEGINAQPSMLIVRKPNSEDQTSLVHPLDLVFRGAKFFSDHEAQDAASMHWLPRRLTMLLARHGLVVGFTETDGWKFAARTDEPTEEQR